MPTAPGHPGPLIPHVRGGDQADLATDVRHPGRHRLKKAIVKVARLERATFSGTWRASEKGVMVSHSALALLDERAGF